MWLATRLLVKPLRNFFFELRLNNAIQVAGILDFDHRPVFPHRLQWGDVKSLHRVAVSDDDDNRDMNPPEFRFSQSQFAEIASAGRRGTKAISAWHPLPHLLKRAAFTQPPHSTDHAGKHALLIPGHEFDGDHPAHRIADDMRLLNLE